MGCPDDEDEMGKWDDRVVSHAVNGSFAAALGMLENLTAEQVDASPENVDRLLRVVNHVRDRVTRTPSEFVTMSSLNTIQQQLNSLQSNLSQFVNMGNAAYLDNANNDADALLDTARLLPPLPPVAGVEAVAADADRVRRLVSTVVAAAEAEVSGLREATDGVQRTSQESSESFAAQAMAAKEQVAALQTEVHELTQRLEEALGAQQTQFEEAEAVRAEAAEANAVGTLDRLEELKADAEKVVGAIGVAGVAKGYSDTAEAERDVADVWRYATVGVAALAALVLAWSLFTVTGETSWQMLVTRLVVSISLAGLAAYCGRQSEQHRKVERDARARHLQLAALNSYLADLPDDNVVELKAQLAPGYFSPATATAKGDGDSKDGGGLLSAEQWVELFRMLTTKGAPN